MSEAESYDSKSEKMSDSEEDRLPVVHELCPLPEIANKKEPSISHKTNILTSSEYIFKIKNPKLKIMRSKRNVMRKGTTF
jgi:hypothetical protein